MGPIGVREWVVWLLFLSCTLDLEVILVVRLWMDLAEILGAGESTSRSNCAEVVLNNGSFNGGTRQAP